MSRIKQLKIIDQAIHSIAMVTESQYSLSDGDLRLLNEASQRLQLLRKKKGKTNEQIQQEIANVSQLLITLFTKNN